jgi:hypothetical protein
MLSDSSKIIQTGNESMTEQYYNTNINTPNENSKSFLPADILKQLCDK